jgi:hypothetical protein
LITNPTTFVVGAGASVPFGLPVGAKLMAEARGLQHDSPNYQLLRQVFKADQLDAFLSDLRGHPEDSIDAFLEHRQHVDETMTIGRALIAALMGRHMATSQKRAADGNDWVTLIIRKMGKGASRAAAFTAAAKTVSFVTFNFDSIIEETAERAIRGMYRADTPDDVNAAVAAVVTRVVHVHGRLPQPPARPLEDPSQQVLTVRGSLVNVIELEWVEWVRQAATAINVILDPADEAAMAGVRSVIEQSFILCFLGFRYEWGNLKKIGIPKHLARDASYQHLFGTAVNIQSGERDQIKVRFADRTIQFGGDKEECHALLEHFHIFRD